MSSEQLKCAIDKNRQWFINSGVMPDAGRWGVAERILLTENNSEAGKALKSFPAWTFFKEGCILEQRRTDCCFQTAYYFLLSEKHTDHAIAEKIINYLYNLSGMLSRSEQFTSREIGIWTWSNIGWTPGVWFDDNAWAVMLALEISNMRPDLDAKYRMKDYALRGAAAQAAAFRSYWPERTEKSAHWSGNLALPHWGALTCAALAAASAYVDAESAHEYRAICMEYLEYLDQTSFNASEMAYSLIFFAVSGCVFERDRDRFIDSGERMRSKLLARFDEKNISFPAEHSEAPNGELLSDFIYTVNWALVGLLEFEQLSFCIESREVIEAIIDKLLLIQDNCGLCELDGCWRGMFDNRTGCWGGGNKYEGGAGSIYTGWTNAPIGWSLAKELKNTIG